MLYYIYNILYDFIYTDISVDEIIPGLWLGNYKAALDIDFLKQTANFCVNRLARL